MRFEMETCDHIGPRMIERRLLMHEPPPSVSLALVLCVAGVAFLPGAITAAASGQPYTGDPREIRELRQIDQGLADQTPLSASTRVVPLDLRQPVGFDQLFQLTGPGGRLETRGLPLSSGLFFRFSGALTATFPRSVYSETPAGLQPMIPPGTVFSIGQKPLWGPGPRVVAGTPRTTASERARLATPAASVARPARAASAGSPVPGARGKPDGADTLPRETREIESLWTSEAYRRRLIERLLLIVAPE